MAHAAAPSAPGRPPGWAAPLVLHVALPLALGLGAVWGYHWGPRWLSEAFAPDIGREYGLLEWLQALVLAGVVAVAARGAWRGRGATRVVLGLLAAVALFTLLEEIEYGVTVADLLANRPVAESLRSLHGANNLYMPFKLAGDAAAIALLGFLPMLPAGALPSWLRPLRPSRWFIGTLLAMGAVAALALAGRDSFGDAWHPLVGNASEFRELLLYFAALLYAAQLAPPVSAGQASDPAGGIFIGGGRSPDSG